MYGRKRYLLVGVAVFLRSGAAAALAVSWAALPLVCAAMRVLAGAAAANETRHVNPPRRSTTRTPP
ncbi:hypothetical protein AB0Q95_04375 [Streptomyces sp. NPDC059900]|uniref:hypothetical protein n=1 Tax=Streptomyces sp. NPDC059900 TaxID=3155816 RepID=UPI003414F049